MIKARVRRVPNKRDFSYPADKLQFRENGDAVYTPPDTASSDGFDGIFDTHIETHETKRQAHCDSIDALNTAVNTLTELRETASVFSLTTTDDKTLLINMSLPRLTDTVDTLLEQFTWKTTLIMYDSTTNNYTLTLTADLTNQ